MGNERWKSFRAEYMQTDLWIAVSAGNYNPGLEKFSVDRIRYYRAILDRHISVFARFLTSLEPLPPACSSDPLILEMYRASAIAGTGPMAAVAGVFAEFICNDIIQNFGVHEIVAENGGDIFMKIDRPATISVLAGQSVLSGKIGIIVKPGQSPVSICCSSGTFGHSFSMGVADACVIACKSGALADAYATACCNEVKNDRMVQQVTEMFLEKKDVLSVVIIKDDKVGLGGQMEITIL